MLSFSGEKAFMDNVHYDIHQMTINGNYADVFVSTHERYSDAVVMYFDDEDVFV